MTEEQIIRQALLQAAALDLAQKNLPEAPPFSPTYAAWEKRFLSRFFSFSRWVLRPPWQKALQAAACLFLVLSLAAATLLAVSPQARAWVELWLTYLGEQQVTYSLEGDEPVKDDTLWAPQRLPNGYAPAAQYHLEHTHVIVYRNQEGDEIEFSYDRMIHGNEISLDNKDRTRSPLSVNGMPGYLSVSETDPKPNSLIWFDQEAQYAFLLVSSLSPETLLSLAESVAPVP